MRHVFALFFALLFLLVLAFADDDLEFLVGGEGEEQLLDEPLEDVVASDPELEPVQVLVLDSGPLPVMVVEPEPDAVVYAAGTVGPDGGYYFQVSSSALGTCTVWLPFEYVADSFSWYGGQLVSLRSSSIFGIVVSGSTVYNLRFSGFLQGAEYRHQSGSSWYWSPLNISAVSGANIEILDDSPGYQLDISHLIIIAVILVVGVRLLGLSR